MVELLSLGENHARTLLIHYRWDVEKLHAVLAEKGKSFLFAQAGITLDGSRVLHPPDSSATTMCLVCMEDVPGSEVTEMECGHCFCNNCKHYFFCICSCSRLILAY